jgi:hypothetical protein
VIIVSSQNSFDDLAWSRQVFRFLKSATRSGFIKKLRVEEYDAFSSEQRSNIVSVLEKIESRYRVEIQWHKFEGMVYICVLEHPGITDSIEYTAAIEAVGNVFHNRYRPWIAEGGSRGATTRSQGSKSQSADGQ